MLKSLSFFVDKILENNDPKILTLAKVWPKKHGI